ncbi:site-specific DNA-methyltransferase [Curtobacterium sp. MCBD17_040]|uniref:DNA-methyltransferase n=1 Tax=Curtobacterium sp. MCBD17_040 TaxID=2175674 RepID=UPI000DA90801|nr:site-specific DNA-methyltransferase [Curtobacterium sp. MCBD17_040]WIB65353.1 site-specific DNA-methyltransferase [Curtobacterium sp. MCBD17_040]
MTDIAPWYQDDWTTVFSGDSLTVLATLPDNSVDAVVTDPPYGLANLPAKKVALALTEWIGGNRAFIPGGKGFMGNDWDRFVPPPALWDEVFRVLKPGGYLLTWSGARTQDLMGMSVRLAGFQVKDAIAWSRADSFPKTKHSLKPGYEPILMVQKPLEGTIEQNIAKWGTGGIHVDDVRTPFRNAADRAETVGKNKHGQYGTKQGGNSVFGDFSMLADRKDYDPEGRLPTNLILDEEMARRLDAANPPSKSSKGKPRAAAAGEGWGMTATGAEYDDEGGPSRFFPVFSADDDPLFYAGRAPAKERPVGEDGTKHPTVKPLSLMSWTLKLVVPPNGVVLDPFLGSGTTVEAARIAGFRSIGVEAHEPFLELIKQRIIRSTPKEA